MRRSLPSFVLVFGVDVIGFSLVMCLGESELLILCVELDNNDSGWALCVVLGYFL